MNRGLRLLSCIALSLTTKAFKRRSFHQGRKLKLIYAGLVEKFFDVGFVSFIYQRSAEFKRCGKFTRIDSPFSPE